MRRLWKLVVCLVICVALPAAAERPTPFRYWKAIDRDDTGNEEIVAVALDSDVYAATRGGLPDIRVVDEVLAEAPYHLEPDVEYREEQSRQVFDTEIDSLHEQGTGIEVRLPTLILRGKG